MLRKDFGFTKDKWNNTCWEGRTDPAPGKRFAQYIQHEDLHASIVCAEMLLSGNEVYPIYTAGMVENYRFKGITTFYYQEERMIPIFTSEEYYRQTDGDSLIPLRDISQIYGLLAAYSKRTCSYRFDGVVINPHTDGFYIKRGFAVDLLTQSIYPPQYIRSVEKKEDTGETK